MWRPDDPQGNETAKVKYLIVPYTRGIGADIGCGPWKGFPHWVGVDSCKDTALFGIQMKPDIEADVSKAMPFEDGELDFAFSSHTLEHIVDYKAALAEWWRCIKVGGHLVLYLPHADLYPRCGEPGANPDHVSDFVPEDIIEAMREIGCWDLLVKETRALAMEYSFLLVFRKAESGHAFSCHAPRPKKTALVCRFGGFGDQIQASNILPGLKRQGFHVTFMTTPAGQSILEHDPHVDDWIIQDTDQVPNHELTGYWAQWAERFDRFVNLSESVEGTLLAIPGRANHAWPQEMRRKYLGHNYLEFTAEIAQVPYRSEARFYPSEDEADRAKRYRQKMGSGFAVMWALAGSSLHKFYPWQDSVIARIMVEIPGATVVTVGDDACKLLEQGWEAEPRVFMESGNLSIRDTLALAQRVDCVVGPETGVLNAVGFEESVGKVCLLSHSSHENLTKHWKNSHPIAPPESVKCYPCHRLHYSRDHCFEHEESGTAICQAAIDPARVFDAILKIHKRWSTSETRRAA